MDRMQIPILKLIEPCVQGQLHACAEVIFEESVGFTEGWYSRDIGDRNISCSKRAMRGMDTLQTSCTVHSLHNCPPNLRVLEKDVAHRLIVQDVTTRNDIIIKKLMVA